MTVFVMEGTIRSNSNMVSYHDITDSVKKAVEQSNIHNGTCTVVTPHTTCAIFFEEYTHDVDEYGVELLQVDMNRILENIVPLHNNAQSYRYPGEQHYKEVLQWPDSDQWLPNGDRSFLWNGDAHIKATLIGCSEVFAVTDQQLYIGRTGYIYFVDFDRTRSRDRKYKIIVQGE